MADNKTRPTKASALRFLRAVEHPTRRADALELLAMMREVTGWKPVMWGPSIVGFGSYGYAYDSGRTGRFMVTGFAPRKQDLTVYVMPGFRRYEALLAKLGKHRHSVSCLYLKKLDDVDRGVLRRLVERSVADMRQKYECREPKPGEKA